MKLKNFFIRFLKLFGIFFIFFYSWLFQLIPVIIFNISDKLLERESVNIILGTFSSIMLGLILFVIYKKDIIKEFRMFKNNLSDCFDKGLTCWVGGLFAMMVLNFIIGNLLGAGEAANEEAVQSMIDVLPFFMFINAGFLAPWNEELVFRKAVKEFFTNKWLYIFISGLLFGLAHVVGGTTSWVDWLYVLPYGGLGAAFAYAYYDTDTIFTPILFHMIHNVIILIFSIFL